MRIYQDIKESAYFALKWSWAFASTTIHQDIKEAAYKGQVRPFLEYGNSVWVLHEELESMQKHAAKFVIGNNNYCYRYSLFYP